MNFYWHKYKVRGVDETTGKKKTLRVVARNEDAAKADLGTRGLVAPYDFEEEEFEPPTEKQMNYALDLGIKIYPSMCKKDVSALLDKHLESDSEPSEELMAFAYFRDIYFSPYIGAKSLCNLIFDSLELKDKIAFFCYAVNQSLKNQNLGNMDSSPDKEKFYEFATLYDFDDSFLRSFKSYTGEDMLFFGAIYDEDGVVEYGGSTRKKAYKLAADYVRNGFSLIPQEFNLDTPKPTINLGDALLTVPEDFPEEDTGLYLSDFNLDGAGGNIRLTVNCVVIKLTGLVKFFAPADKRNLVIPIRKIVDVHIFEAKSWWRETSYIRFVCEGDNTRFFHSSELPKTGAEHDSSVYFSGNNNLLIAEKIKSYVMSFNGRG